MMLTEISRALLDWYQTQARVLPWRDHPDPYAVWISEIMLQQTRVETVIPYFQRWMLTFPNIETLAKSKEQDVLKLWEGLGYYSRARNIHKAAAILQSEWEGKLPSERTQLEKLPGIGKYTAAAIASMAFGKDEATLDGNIRRVLARLFNIDIPARSAEGEKLLWHLAEVHLPPGKAGDYNQAWMDLGASICLPKNPRCLLCPLQNHCLAFAAGVQEERPVLPVKKKTPHYIVTAAIIQRDQKILLAQRPPDGLLGGLWEFPGGKQEKNESLEQALYREIEEELACQIKVGAPFGIYKHAFTHFKITLHAFLCELIQGEPYPVEASQIVWIESSQLMDYPMGKVDRQIAEKLRSVLPH
jgi:A/G-specific adenine glycosylase